MFDILIVNYNCLDHTKNLYLDLMSQNDTNFDVHIIDQGSTEPGTHEFLDGVPNTTINTHNRPLNHVWNDFVEASNKDFICLLNNDIRIPKNFITDLITIFENALIGMVMHPTNHPNYDKALPQTSYDVLSNTVFRQGWDMCLRKSGWTKIPEILEFYCGDDFIFQTYYNRGYRSAMATSSPIIHYLSQTRRSSKTQLTELKPKTDVANYIKLGYNHHLKVPLKYTIVEFKDSPVNEIKE